MLGTLTIARSIGADHVIDYTKTSLERKALRLGHCRYPLDFRLSALTRKPNIYVVLGSYNQTLQVFWPIYRGSETRNDGHDDQSNQKIWTFRRNFSRDAKVVPIIDRLIR
jgi:hypothetical protein